MQAEVAQRDQRLSALQGETGQRDQRIAALQADVAQRDERLSAAQGVIGQRDQRIAELERRPAQAAPAFGTEAMARIRTTLQARQGVQVQGDRIVVASGVLFASGSSELGAAGRDNLARVADALKESLSQLGNTPWILQIEGHTDRRAAGRGTNWDLSASRAVTVLRFLESRGVPSDRLAAVGMGEYQPVDRGNTEDALARNRRIELRFVAR